jgi:hypothetical protein
MLITFPFLCGMSLGAAAGERSTSTLRRALIDHIVLDVGINMYHQHTPYDAGLYFQLEALNISKTKVSKRSKPSTSSIEVHSHVLAHGGHFGHLIQRYRPPSITKSVGPPPLIAFGMRLSVSRLQELMCAATARCDYMYQPIHLGMPRSIKDQSSLPIVFVVSWDDMGPSELLATLDSKKAKDLKYELVASSRTATSPYADIAIVLHVLHSCGIGSTYGLHQLQRTGTRRIGKGRRGADEFLSGQNLYSLASAHGVVFVVSLVPGKDIRLKPTGPTEPAVRVRTFHPLISISFNVL